MADRIGAAGGKQQDEAREQRDAGPEGAHRATAQKKSAPLKPFWLKTLVPGG